MKRVLLFTVLSLSIFTNTLFAQVATNKKALDARSKSLAKEHSDNLQKAYTLAKQNHWELIKNNYKHGVSCLVGVDNFNRPIYYTTLDNTIAAATVGANKLWPGGSSGLNISSGDSYLKNKLAIWDGGGVLGTHVELAGRVTQKDGAAVSTGEGSVHATHVTGTMMATGINPLAKGMSFKMPGIQAYDFNNDNSEMSSAAAGLLLSNHSYGTISGWYLDTNGDWIFEGVHGDTADLNFGYYNSDAQTWDNIAFNAPYYTIVKAAGNNRNENGPAVGGIYYYYDESGVKQQGIRPAGISNNDSYRTIATNSNAKNIITVGAVNGIPNGYKTPSDVVMTDFSSWGPTDDGRIKPDLVADGVNLLSCSADSNTAYTTLSGTSMATPNVTGSLMLLQDYYSHLRNGTFMRAATLKGLAIHTANEAGSSPGPDYQFGWGLLNVAKAADVITAAIGGNNASTSKHLMYENVLNNGQTDTIKVVASGNSPITATISWTDPAGSVVNSNILNNTNIELVNDLDLRITNGGTTYYPWVLNPFVPAAAATKGDNYLDNVEKIEIDTVVPGQVYTIIISHKGTLTNGSQAYSLIVSGGGGQQYCTPSQTSSSGASINNVSFGGINYTNSGGCVSYSNLTNQTATIKPNQSLPININLGSCDGLAHSKTVNVYIDYNGNGSFNDSGELVATGSVSGINNTFTATVTPPSSLTIGAYTLMRIVAVDTTNVTTINPCSTYMNGETQDYRVFITQPDNDIALSSIITPITGDYSSSTQMIAVQITNNGSLTQSSVVLNTVVKSGNTIVANLSGTYPDSIASGATVTYTFQSVFASIPSTNYTITATASIPVDNFPSNNSLTENITIAPPVAATANDCSGTTTLKVTSPSGTKYAWYNNTLSTASPIATGTQATVALPTSETIVYLGTGTSGFVGPVDKGTYTGGYQANTSNYLNYSSKVPVILESARLYTHNPGTITIAAADISNASLSGYNYQVLNSTTLDVYSTNPTLVSGAVAGNDPTDTGAVFYINMVLPAGNHSIIVFANDATIYRTNGLPIGGYPYSIPNVFAITGNSAAISNPSDTNFYKAYYYYLYNMKIKTEDCVGDRIPVDVVTSPLPEISFKNDSLESSVSDGNQWYLNGTAIAGATTQNYVPSSAIGVYYDLVTDSFGCQRQSNSFSIDKLVALVGPNPSKGQFNLSFYVPVKTNIAISLVNIAGQRIPLESFSEFVGNFSQAFATNSLASGIYILEIQHGNEVERKKLFIYH